MRGRETTPEDLVNTRTHTWFNDKDRHWVRCIHCNLELRSDDWLSELPPCPGNEFLLARLSHMRVEGRHKKPDQNKQAFLDYIQEAANLMGLTGKAGPYSTFGIGEFGTPVKDSDVKRPYGTAWRKWLQEENDGTKRAAQAETDI